MKDKFLYPSLAALFAFALFVLSEYGSSINEVPEVSDMSGFVLTVFLLRFGFVLLLVLSAYGYGGLVFRKWLPEFGSLLEEAVIRAALGLIVVSYLVFGMGLAGLLYRPFGYAILGVGVLAGAMDLRKFFGRLSEAPRSVRVGLSGIILVTLSAYFLFIGLRGALMPPTGFDVLMYHFGIPKMYLDAGGIFLVSDVPGASFPSGVDMLYMLGLMLEGPVSANMVNYFFAVGTALAIAGFLRRFAEPDTGLAGFALFVSIPMVVWLMPQAYIELGLAFYTFVGLYALLAALRDGDRKWFIVGSLLAGFTMAVKYSGLVLVCGIGALMLVHFLALERAGAGASFRRLALFAGLALAVSVPWYIKNAVYYHNPVYPFLISVFNGGIDMPTAPSVISGHAGTAGGVTGLLTGFWRTTFEPAAYKMGWSNGFGPYFLMLLPGLLVFRDMQKELKYLLALSVLLFVMLLPHHNIRYIFPVLPGLAALAAYPVGRMLGGNDRAVRAAGALFVAMVAFAAVMSTTHKQSLEEYPSASASAADKYYSQNNSGYLVSYGVWKWIDENLPEDAVVFELWDDASVYFRTRETIGYAQPWGDRGRQKICHIDDNRRFAGFLPGEEIIANLQAAGAGYFLINANREGRSVPQDEYFKKHAKPIINYKNIILYELTY